MTDVILLFYILICFFAYIGLRLLFDKNWSKADRITAILFSLVSPLVLLTSISVIATLSVMVIIFNVCEKLNKSQYWTSKAIL